MLRLRWEDYLKEDIMAMEPKNQLKKIAENRNRWQDIYLEVML